MLSTSKKIQYGDLVIIYHSYGKLKPLYLAEGETLTCKEGVFPHSAFVGLPFGGLVAGRMPKKSDPTQPQLLVLKPTPELWTRSVPRRTQIIYATDISIIVQNLGLFPGKMVAEAGTGSGSLTHALASAVAPGGSVFTFDFHKSRYEEASQEFKRNGLASVIKADWRDVCSATSTQDNSGPPAGFDLPNEHLDAVFLDVPNPWEAVHNVRNVLKPGGIFCSFSPCIEQTQRLVEAVNASQDSFCSIRTVEALGREFQVSTYRSKRGREADPVDEVPQFVPTGLSKGHSAFLTFCTKRIGSQK